MRKRESKKEIGKTNTPTRSGNPLNKFIKSYLNYFKCNIIYFDKQHQLSTITERERERE